MSLLSPTGAFGKDTWLPGCFDQLENTPGLFYNLFDTIDPVRIEGRRTFFKLEKGDSLGQSVIPDGGDFPDAEDPEYAEGQLDMSRLAHTAQLTFGEWEMLNTDAAAAVPVVERKLFKAVQKMTREIARISMMDGSAVLARAAASSASTTVNLQAVDGTGGAAVQADRDRYNWLAGNRALIDIVDATTGVAITNGTRRKVIDVNPAANTITLDAAGGNVSTTTSHRIVWHKSVSSVGGAYVSGEFPGVNAILKTDRTYLGINSAAAGNSYWDATVVSGDTPGTNQMISLDRLLKLRNRMANSAGDGMQPSRESEHCVFSNFGVASAAIEYLAPGIRYADPKPGDTADFAWQRVEGLGLMWYTDVHYPHNVLDILHKPSIKRVKPKRTMQEILDFLTVGADSMWHLANASVGQGHAAKVNAYLTGLIALMTPKPAEHGRLDDIIELGV